jgi:hypothetical protein
MTETLVMAEIGPRSFETVQPGACYRLSLPGIETYIEADRLAWRAHELSGEIKVTTALAGTMATDGVLSVSRLNISSTRARSEFANHLERASRAKDIPWAHLIAEFAQRILAAERTGEPAVALRDVPRPIAQDRALRLFGFCLPLRHATIIFGDGGASKSLLSLYLGGRLAEDGYRVLLADWELDGADHRERFEQLFGADMPATLFYTRCSRPLVHDADRLTRLVRQQGIDFGIFDSVGFACHEAPETAAAALAYFQGARQIGIGGIHIAHINRSESGDQKPFGSQFWHNSARATYFLKPTEDSQRLTVGVFNRKSNLGPKLPPFAYDVEFDGGRTIFRQTEISDVSELSGQVPLSQRLRAYLKAGSRTREEIAREFDDEKPDTIRRTLERQVQRGQLVKFPTSDGSERYGLKARTA